MHYIQIQIGIGPVSFSPVLGLIEIVKGYGVILLRYTTVMKCYYVLYFLK